MSVFLSEAVASHKSNDNLQVAQSNGENERKAKGGRMSFESLTLGREWRCRCEVSIWGDMGNSGVY